MIRERQSYQNLQNHRLILAGLVLGLTVVIMAILFEVYYQGARSSQVDPTVRRLALPLNPVLDVDVLEQLQGYEQLSLEQVRQFFVNSPPSARIAEQLALQDASASGSADTVSQTIEENTLSEEEILSDEQLDALLNTEVDARAGENTGTTTVEGELPEDSADTEL